MSDESPVMYTIEFVCSSCAKKAEGKKEMYKDPIAPIGWRTIVASSVGNQTLVRGLFCITCAPMKMTEIALLTTQSGHEINVQLTTLVR